MLTNKQYRFLKYIKKHKNVTYRQLASTYRKQDINSILIAISPYILKYNCDEILDKDGFSTGEYRDIDSSYYSCGNPGIIMIEQRRRDKIKWLIPTIISIIALIISIANTIINFAF